MGTMRGLIGRVFIWSGGAIFAASLALTGWLYVSAFSRNGDGPHTGAILIDTALLSIFALHHSIFARPALKAAMARLVPERLIRSCYVWVASLLLIAVCAWWQPVGSTVYRFSGVAAVPFIAVQLMGTWLIVRAVRAIRALELAGIEAPRPRQGELQIAGAYRLVRHPLYLGWVLAVGGTAHMTGDRLLFAVVTTAYIAIAIPWEERGLVAEFGDAYQRYRRQVRWRLLPFVY
jgi:protein-S-isoprenylcysteine O-methyltransferase Ste14